MLTKLRIIKQRSVVCIKTMPKGGNSREERAKRRRELAEEEHQQKKAAYERRQQERQAIEKSNNPPSSVMVTAVVVGGNGNSSDGLQDKSAAESTEQMAANIGQGSNDGHVPQTVVMTNITNRLSECASSQVSTASTAQEDYDSHANRVKKEQMITLIRSFAGGKLFHVKKYFFDTEAEFAVGSKTYNMMFNCVGLTPTTLKEDERQKLTAMFRKSIKSVIGSKRSTVVDAMRKRYMGKKNKNTYFLVTIQDLTGYVCDDFLFFLRFETKHAIGGTCSG